ncbi:tricarboxylate transport protein TctC [Marinobacterium aestuarii]|uniref:Tricarboxylate transport protein TctC n=1 Tax=Marinobacterium aestuarii TaxID=1821621 RepID=A0A1A9EU72_9GAMM|nr:tripartite tricarboxylate transporter substrate binding protein [Marinobacterium aestuarii]ANG61694.1 tricarboxylate transport protein TctC [Marinobacterium aestuarii]
MTHSIKKALVCSALAGLLSTGLQAADFPEKNLQGAIMWGAGGATDNVARAVTPLVEPLLGGEIVLVNKSGGAGAISTNYVNSRPSDGYTLLYGAENPQLHKVLGLSKLDYADFYPVNILARGVVVIVANNDKPWTSMKELVADAQANPGTVKMGSTGPGGLPFVVGAMLKTATDFDVRAVPFDGEGPGITALQGGHVDFMPAGLTAVREHIRAGRVKALAVLSDTPVAGLEEIPLITADLPEFKKFLPWGPFYGVFAKRDIPEDAKAKLTDAFQQAAATEQFGKFMQDFGAVVTNISGDEADAFLKHWQSVTAWSLEAVGETKVSPAEFGIAKP